MMKFRSLSLYLAVALFFTGSALSPALAQDTGTPPAYLFVLEGRNAVLKPMSKPGKFELTVPLRKPNQLVTWFTDRPNRDAGHMSVKTLASLWQQSGDDSFKSNPPNVALSFGKKTLIATMTNPKIVNTRDGRETLVSTMTLIQGQNLEQLAQGAQGLTAHAKRAGANSHSGQRLRIPSLSLFIDTYMTPICIGIEGIDSPECIPE
jgi:hypothetical protein